MDVRTFRRLWAELHTRAICSTGDVRSELAFLRQFDRRIRCNSCRRHWRAILEEHPPELDSPYRFFRWTVRAHNEVNRSLGKPLFPFAEACKRWGYTPSYDDL